jgi:hypothetical protein
MNINEMTQNSNLFLCCTNDQIPGWCTDMGNVTEYRLCKFGRKLIEISIFHSFSHLLHEEWTKRVTSK